MVQQPCGRYLFLSSPNLIQSTGFRFSMEKKPPGEPCRIVPCVGNPTSGDRDGSRPLSRPPPLPLTCAGVASHEPGITTHDCDRRQVRRQPLRTIIAVLRGTVFISTLGSSFFPARTHPAPTPNKRETSLPPQKVSTTFLPHPLNTGP